MIDSTSRLNFLQIRIFRLQAGFSFIVEGFAADTSLNVVTGDLVVMGIIK